ncbi:hypothetical protein Patl1_20550 [Pistacia atlantica]|uniref:Uncharacterized protein n=1 Tax=Pistacia atlantica TaxID=434234 RepID=A0ACC1BKW0_9ROSI|nr:hypothetical protein Patl1_20550 [Pistacia atlantica]
MEYNGKRDGSELNNFLWHVERYFSAIKLLEEKEKANQATMYLHDLASSWWYRKYDEIKRGTCRIET